MVARFAVRATVLLMATAVLVLAAGAQETPTPFGETIEVRRILTEVRVVDDAGNPMTGLGPSDFRVRISGKNAQVDSVSWIPMTTEAASMTASPPDGIMPSGTPLSAPEPRLIVVLFQTDIGRQQVDGVMRMAPYAADFVRDLPPEDRVALLTFESHLELRSDFTTDHEGLAEMITATEIFSGSIEAPEPSTPRMGDLFDVDEAWRAANITRAIELVAQSLIPIQGPKTLVLFGWGIGRFNRGHPITMPGYNDAAAALAAARTSVFSLDISTADYHTLEVGLMKISRDTGGIYLKTHLFPKIAMDKFVRVISSYYELSIVPPPELKEGYRIDVKVKRPGARVYVRQNHPNRNL